MLAGQPETQVVLREQDLRDPGKDLRLVIPDPDELRRGEARKDDIAGDLAEARIGIERRRLPVGARIVPQDAGPQDLVVPVEQCGAMHLPRKAEALHRAEFGREAGLQAGHRLFCRAYPVSRVLFRPARMRPRHVQRAVCRADDPLVAVDEHGLDA